MMKYKYILIFALITLSVKPVFAQLSQQEEMELRIKQDSLKVLSEEMINAYDRKQKLQATNDFIPALVEALKIRHSFSFSFDSLEEVSILYNKEKSFRIFTWAIALAKYQYRFYGAIQKKTKDGNLELYALFDNSFFTKNKDTIGGSKSWQGALYYNLIEEEFKNKKYYTLIGWAGKNLKTQSKVLDVLTFANGTPRFGAPIFDLTKKHGSPHLQNRFFLVYKSEAKVELNYNQEMDLIVYDHLTSLTNHAEDSSSLVPDGTYSGFQWKNGKWEYLDKIFSDSTNNEEAPRPHPMKFNNPIEGNKSKP